MRGHAVVSEQGVQEGTKHKPLRGRRVKCQRGEGVLAYLHHLGAACQEVQDPVVQGLVQTQGPRLGDELGGHYGVEG